MRDVITTCYNSKFYNDYKRILLEWTFNRSEQLINVNLSSMDSEMLAGDVCDISTPVINNIDNVDFLDKLIEENDHIIYGEDD